MKNKSLFIVMGIFLVVLFNSIVYGAINSDMFINGEVHIRVDKDIRITGLKVVEQANDAYETYNCDYSKDTTSLQVTLPSSDSTMIYEVTITNKGDTDYEVTEIVESSYSNSNIKYELIDLEKGNIIDGGSTHTFKIKLTTTENDLDNKVTLVLKYIFQETTREWLFSYTGGDQEFKVPYDGEYKIELWGAQGGSFDATYIGGYGGYTVGNINLNINTNLYIYVGGVGSVGSTSRAGGGYNGGGNAQIYVSSALVRFGGGGATDIRYFGSNDVSTSDLNFNSTIGLNSRIMVAAGGGGRSPYGNSSDSIHAGGLIGYNDEVYSSGKGGTQISGGLGYSGSYGVSQSGSFGQGGYGNSHASGGGGGYYGGGGGARDKLDGSGGGGSSFISGHTGCVAIASEQNRTPKDNCTTGTADNNCSIHYSNKVFTNTKMIDGAGYNWTNIKGEYIGMPSHDGVSTIVGNTGNGYAKITLITKK